MCPPVRLLSLPDHSHRRRVLNYNKWRVLGGLWWPSPVKTWTQSHNLLQFHSNWLSYIDCWNSGGWRRTLDTWTGDLNKCPNGAMFTLSNTRCRGDSFSLSCSTQHYDNCHNSEQLLSPATTSTSTTSHTDFVSILFKCWFRGRQAGPWLGQQPRGEGACVYIGEHSPSAYMEIISSQKSSLWPNEI